MFPELPVVVIVVFEILLLVVPLHSVYIKEVSSVSVALTDIVSLSVEFATLATLGVPIFGTLFAKVVSLFTIHVTVSIPSVTSILNQYVVFIFNPDLGKLPLVLEVTKDKLLADVPQ